jgi:hypothetical protein
LAKVTRAEVKALQHVPELLRTGQAGLLRPGRRRRGLVLLIRLHLLSVLRWLTVLRLGVLLGRRSLRLAVLPGRRGVLSLVVPVLLPRVVLR